MKNSSAALTLFLTLTFVTSPLLTRPFSGFRADQLPIPQIDPPIQPEGYAFAIWGLIYAWLVVSAVFGLQKRADSPTWNRVRWSMIVSLGVGTPWLAIANTTAIWATILIFVMAAGAIIALLRAPQDDRWWLRVPVAIYAGWLTAASFVSLGSTAAGYGVLTDQLGWAYLGILGALVVAITVFRRTRSISYGLTVVWALVAICVANGTTVLSVTALAAVGIAVLLFVIMQSQPVGQSVTS